MSMRKIMLFAGMALSLVAFVLPASAMAEDTIRDNGALKEKAVSFKGEAEFNTLGTGIKCSEVTLTVEVTDDLIVPIAFSVDNPTTKCTFFGATYKECAFETHPAADDLNTAKITIDTVSGAEHLATVDAPTNAELHPTITSELTTRAGSTSPCNVTTNDLTVVKEPNVELSADIETTGGFISGLKLTGKVRVDRGLPGEGTKTPSSANIAVGVAGTLAITTPNTYKVE